MENKEKIIAFDMIWDSFENQDIKHNAQELVKQIPDYFFIIPASSTGKYHPSYSLGKGGLLRHTIAVVRFLNFYFDLDFYKEAYNSKERDLLRLAAIMHDSMKNGSQEDYNNGQKYTKFDHPLLAANLVRNTRLYMPSEDQEFVASAIEAHMGQWNTDKRSDMVLPLPVTKYQKLLHQCDFLASRKDITLSFAENPSEAAEVSRYTMPFGKYKGELITNVPKDYLKWLKENNKELKEPLLGMIKHVIG